MKAMLVIDVEEYGEYYVDVYRKDTGDEFEGRHYLKSMPQQMLWGHTADFIEGYNACLDEITGEIE